MTATFTPSAWDVLALAERMGVVFRADEERLLFDAPAGVMNPQLRQLLKLYKRDLVELVRRRHVAAMTRLREVAATWRPEWREYWEERAAISEYDGELSRDLAEEHAFHELVAWILAEHEIHYLPGSVSTSNLLLREGKLLE